MEILHVVATEILAAIMLVSAGIMFLFPALLRLLGFSALGLRTKHRSAFLGVLGFIAVQLVLRSVESTTLRWYLAMMLFMGALVLIRQELKTEKASQALAFEKRQTS